MYEDTLAHEEIFGALPEIEKAGSNFGRLAPRRLGEGEIYKPIIGFQHKDNHNGTYSVRFYAAVEAGTTEAVWTRSVHDVDGLTTHGKTKGNKTATMLYPALNNNGSPAFASDEQADEEAATPFSYYAVYCLINIPEENHSDYYVDAFITVTKDAISKSSDVGSLNVVDSSKHIKYSLEGGNRFVAEINGEIRESDYTTTDNLYVESIAMNANDTFRAYSLNIDNLTYKLFDYDDIGEAHRHIVAGSNNELKVTSNGTYRFFLNKDAQPKFYIDREVHFIGLYWWWNDWTVTTIELSKNSEGLDCVTAELAYVRSYENGEGDEDDTRFYTGFVTDKSVYTHAQFYRKTSSSGNQNHTGFKALPDDNKNLYTQSTGEWTVLS